MIWPSSDGSQSFSLLPSGPLSKIAEGGRGRPLTLWSRVNATGRFRPGGSWRGSDPGWGPASISRVLMNSLGINSRSSLNHGASCGKVSDLVVAGSPDPATSPTGGLQPRPRRETCGPAGPPERGGRGQTSAEQRPGSSRDRRSGSRSSAKPGSYAFFPGVLLVLVLLVLPPLRAWRMASPLGEPRPVHGSQPGPAL